jgi:hypothetical protein
LTNVEFEVTDEQFKELTDTRDQYVKDGDLDVNTDVGAFVKFLLQMYGIIGTINSKIIA